MSKFNATGHVAMISANLMWGIMSPVAKLVMAAGIVTPLLTTSCRMYGAAILFWIASLFTKTERVPKRDLLLLAGAAMLGILINQTCFIFGVGYTSPGEASIITTTMPMWVIFLSWLVLKESITKKRIGGIVLGAIGAITLILSSKSAAVKGNSPLLGDALVFLAQLSYALYLTLYKNFITKYSLVTLMKWMFTFASIALLPVSVPEAISCQWHMLSAFEVAGTLYIVVFGTFLAYVCMMIGQKRLSPTIVGAYNYVQPVVASMIGVILGLDHFTPLKIVAVALIFSGVFLVTRAKS